MHRTLIRLLVLPLLLAAAPAPKPLSGQLLDADNHPIANFKLCLCTSKLMFWQPVPGQSYAGPGIPVDYSTFTTTDANGQFSFPAPGAPANLIAFTPDGYVIAKSKKLTSPATLHFTRWPTLEVVVKIGDHPAPAGISVSAGMDDENIIDELGPWPHYSAVTDDHGHASFGHVVAGEYSVGRSGGVSRSVEVPAGQITSIDLPVVGRSITGHIQLPPEMLNVHCLIQADLIDRRELPALTLPSNILQMTPEQRLAWYNHWETSTPQGQRLAAQQARDHVHRDQHIKDDLAFHFGDVPEGTHYLRVLFYRMTGDDTEYHELASPGYTLTVPPLNGADPLAPIDLGTLAPHPAATINANQMLPDIPYRTADGKDHLLSEFKGKVLFLEIWGTWCGSCLHDLPNVKAIHDTFGANPRFAMLSLSAGDTPEVWQKFLHAHDLPWTHGILGPFDSAWQTRALAVPGYPTYYLVSPEGKILAEGFQSPFIVPFIRDALK